MQQRAGRDAHGVQSVSKALDLLCCFSPNRPEWGITEIAAYLGLCKSAVHRILTTCEQYRFVVRTDAHRYRLGIRTLELGNIYRFDRRLLRQAEPALWQIAQTTQSVVQLAELHGREVLELLRSSSPSSRMLKFSATFREPAHATASGKVLLANCRDRRLTELAGAYGTMRRFTAYTIVSLGELRRELSVVAERGYAISDQEYVIGRRSIGVPVRDPLGKVVAALSLSNTPDNLCEASIPRLLSNLSAAAEMIGRETRNDICPAARSVTS